MFPPLGKITVGNVHIRFGNIAFYTTLMIIAESFIKISVSRNKIKCSVCLSFIIIVQVYIEKLLNIPIIKYCTNCIKHSVIQ